MHDGGEMGVRLGWRRISESVVVDAAPAAVFDLLADPKQHREFDGSTSVLGLVEGPHRLFLGAKFRMSMHLLMPYRITNQVVEFVDDKVIAWQHFGRHIWRYELEDLGNNQTRVTETFDYDKALLPLALELLGVPVRNRGSIRVTLTNLQLRFGSES